MSEGRRLSVADGVCGGYGFIPPTRFPCGSRHWTCVVGVASSPSLPEGGGVRAGGYERLPPARPSALRCSHQGTSQRVRARQVRGASRARKAGEQPAQRACGAARAASRPAVET